LATYQLIPETTKLIFFTKAKVFSSRIRLLLSRKKMCGLKIFGFYLIFLHLLVIEGDIVFTPNIN